MKNKMKHFTLFITLLMVFSLAACAKTTETVPTTQSLAATELTTESSNNTLSQTTQLPESMQTKYPYTVKDSSGEEVVIEKEPTKIISVAPSITELVFALNKGTELIGRTDYCDYPKQSAAVQSIGSLRDPNVEKIVELQPDIVIASTHFKDDVSKKLQDLGIKVVVLYNAEQFDGAYDLINTLGEILNAQNEAKEVVGSMQAKIAEVEAKVKDVQKPKTYYVVGFGKEGDYTATADTFINQMLQMAGADNIAKDATNWKYSLEKIIENDPEYILISEAMKNEFVSTQGYKELSAVKNNKVYTIDENLLNRQGPRLAEGVYEIAKILHPDLFRN